MFAKPASNAPAPAFKLVAPPEAKPLADAKGSLDELAPAPESAKSDGPIDNNPAEPAFDDKPPLANSEKLTKLLKSGVSAGPYLLGPGDHLSIVDPSMGTDEQPFTTETVVAPDGTVSVYPVGVLQAEGLSIGELTELLNERARPFAVNPQMTVTLKERRTIFVHVLGEVMNPGLYSDKKTTIPENKLNLGIGVTLSASETPPELSGLTVLSAVQLAGGVKDTADIRHIRLLKFAEKEPRNIDLWRLLVEGDNSQDLELRSGDTIYVPKGGPPFDSNALGWAVRKPRPIRVLGEVNRPGLYYLGPDDDLITILAKAGGFDTLARQRYVRLSRRNHDGTVTTRLVNVKAAMRDHDKAGRAHVMPGDIVMVDSSIIRRIVPLATYVATIAGAYSLISVISASIPATFQRNLNRANIGNNQAGFAVYGLGISSGFLYGAGARNGAPANIP